MNICNQGSHVSLFAQTGVDVLQVFGFSDSLSRQTDIFSTGIDNAFGLFNAGFGIHSDRIGHTLDAYRVSATHRSGANIYFIRLSS